jgi:chloramphenicol 3-O-phosphotransferase
LQGDYDIFIVMIINNFLQSQKSYKSKIFIIIRGTASSGKSTTSMVLGNLIPIPFVIFHCEDTLFFHMVPSEYLVNGSRSKEGYSLERNSKGDIINVCASDWGSELYMLHTSTLQTYTAAGLNIICEGNFSNEENLKNILQYVPDDYSIFIFSLEVSLKILEEREYKRLHERAVGFAKHQKETSDKFNYIDSLTIHVDENTSPMKIAEIIWDFCQTTPPLSKNEVLSKI